MTKQSESVYGNLHSLFVFLASWFAWNFRHSKPSYHSIVVCYNLTFWPLFLSIRCAKNPNSWHCWNARCHIVRVVRECFSAILFLVCWAVDNSTERMDKWSFCAPHISKKTHIKNLFQIWILCNVCHSNCIHSNVNSHHHQSFGTFILLHFSFCKHRPHRNEIFQQLTSHRKKNNISAFIFSWSRNFFVEIFFPLAFIVMKTFESQSSFSACISICIKRESKKRIQYDTIVRVWPLPIGNSKVHLLL